jgi:GntR family transcriptional regulator, transcriptional repressor for pyruvate dehydrogenase complex
MAHSTQPYQPIARRKVYELIAEQLTAQIGSRALQPGDPLPPERELTQLYRAGRSSVREALRMLESRGLIRPAGNGSFAVADYRNPLNHSVRLLLTLDEATMRDIYELRRILECEAAALAAARREDADLARMATAIQDMEEGLEEPSGDRYIEADLRFHLAIAEAAGNRLLLHNMHALRDVIRRALTSIFQIPASPRSSLEKHRAIQAAIRDRNAEQARDEMRAHLRRVESDVQDVFGRRLSSPSEDALSGAERG